MLKHVSISTISCLAINIALAQQDDTGIIHGTVINETGQYVAGAKVHVHNASDHRIQVRPIRYVETDNDGKFVIDRLEWGLYQVFAMKEADGYPNCSLGVYCIGRKFTANLSPQTPSATVVVVVDPKAGKLTGSISDYLTGQPLSHAVIKVWIWNDVKFFQMSTRSEYSILIPPGTQVGIEIQAPGYEPWRYPGAGSSAQPLLLNSAEILNAEVKLQPKVQ